MIQLCGGSNFGKTTLKLKLKHGQEGNVLVSATKRKWEDKTSKKYARTRSHAEIKTKDNAKRMVISENSEPQQRELIPKPKIVVTKGTIYDSLR